MSKIMEEISSVIEEKVTALNYQLYDLEEDKLGSDKIIRVIINNQNPITLDDCVAVSNELNSYLDSIEDKLPETYLLEVTSPGVERKLTKSVHYEDAFGQKVNVRFYKKNEQINAKEYVGILKDYNKEKIIVDEYEFLLEEISKVNTVYVKKEKND